MNEKFPKQNFNNNWLYRDLLQHDDEIRSLGIDYGKTKRNGIRNIYIRYDAEKDSSGGKSLCTESVVPAVPQCLENVQDTLVEVVAVIILLRIMPSLMALRQAVISYNLWQTGFMQS